ncbi:UNVERIFIED_CONTAM: hypothetical protein HDU68_008133 [Siphonaria sp. JEL0065]|nr:hypothetical protein HDU68_008133 [Siphonaria sp. JEL0065]
MEQASPDKSATPADLAYDVKETREANLTGKKLNDTYVLGKVLGRGSYGTVHAAIDLSHSNRSVAIKEMDAKKLKRKLFMANMSPSRRGFDGILRGRRPIGPNLNSTRSTGSTGSTGSSQSSGSSTAKSDPIDLVREEIAIMKKLNHPNIVRLYEVLHDPNSEIIYMVYELMEKGVVMEVSLDSVTTPFDESMARFYFRQLILGIEYLHEHEISHRDIKPDNLLISNDNVLKIVDFGVSEMFSKQNDMTKKSEGSPAFFAPELCIPNHGEISAKAVDIWAIGVTLYCFVRGQLPFGKSGGSIVEMNDDIKNSNPDLSNTSLSAQLVDLLCKLLHKNPATRITIDEIREHPWTTESGTNPLLPTKAQNCHKIFKKEDITTEELSSAVSNIKSVWTVVSAIQKFKKVLTPTGSRSVSREELNSSASHSIQGSANSLAASGSLTGLGAGISNGSVSDGVVASVVGKSSESLEVPKV